MADLAGILTAGGDTPADLKNTSRTIAAELGHL